MGLYLTIFDGDNEIEGVEVGLYADFDLFRETVLKNVENSVIGSVCPILNLHSDSDGIWTPNEALMLESELRFIADVFKELPAITHENGWQIEVIKSYGLAQSNMYESFFDVDGEPLIERMLKLTELSVKLNLPILFQ